MEDLTPASLLTFTIITRSIIMQMVRAFFMDTWLVQGANLAQIASLKGLLELAVTPLAVVDQVTRRSI